MLKTPYPTNAQDPPPVMPYHPNFWGPFFYKITLWEECPIFEAIFLQNHRNPSFPFCSHFLKTEHLGEICKIGFTGHVFKRSPSKSNPTFFHAIFLKEITEISHIFFQAIFLQTHSPGDFVRKWPQKAKGDFLPAQKWP